MLPWSMEKWATAADMGFLNKKTGETQLILSI